MTRKSLVGSPRGSKPSLSKKMTHVGRQNFFEILYFLRYSTEMMFILNVFMFVNRCTDKNSRKKNEKKTWIFLIFFFLKIRNDSWLSHMGGRNRLDKQCSSANFVNHMNHNQAWVDRERFAGVTASLKYGLKQFFWKNESFVKWVT